VLFVFVTIYFNLNGQQMIELLLFDCMGLIIDLNNPQYFLYYDLASEIFVPVTDTVFV